MLTFTAGIYWLLLSPTLFFRESQMFSPLCLCLCHIWVFLKSKLEQYGCMESSNHCFVTALNILQRFCILLCDDNFHLPVNMCSIKILLLLLSLMNFK